MSQAEADLLKTDHRIELAEGLSATVSGCCKTRPTPRKPSMTPLPVVGVPVKSRALNGLDSLLSIVQMPAGVPVATVAINGAKNAALIAVSSWPCPTGRWPHGSMRSGRGRRPTC